MSDDRPADIDERVRELAREVEALSRRLDTLETALDVDDAGGAATAIDAETAEAASAEVAARASDETGTGGSATANVGTSAGDDRGTRDWELDVGVRWLGILGGLALVVGVAFFVRLAIEAGLLGPLGRVVVGVIGGLTLLGGGRLLAERQGVVRWGRIASGSGLAVAYTSLWAAYGFETYREAIGTPLWAVLLGLTLLVAMTVAVSVHDRAPMVAGEAFLFGYVTAYLGTGADSFVLTPAYALLLAGGVVAVAAVRPWAWLMVASVLPTYGVLWLWIVDLDPTPWIVAVVGLLAFAVYLGGTGVLRTGGLATMETPPATAGVTLLNAPAAAFLLEVTLHEWTVETSGIAAGTLDGLALAVVGVVCLGVLVVTDRWPGWRDDVAGTLGVVLLGAALVTGATTFVGTVGLVGIVVASALVAERSGLSPIATGGHLVAVGAVVKLLTVDATTLAPLDVAEPATIPTGRAAAFAIAVVAFYAVALLVDRRVEPQPMASVPVPIAGAYAAAGTGLAVLLVALEATGLWVTVGWATFGLGLLGIGLGLDRRGVRLLGVAVLGLATGKGFLYDTRGLDAVARTTSFLVLGAILLAASYAYAKTRGEDPLARLRSER